ncbi:MAG TPA: DUF2569 family protein [Gammaproteobacteria bacterium]|jgi:hypothetical protein|nr:DUF2569 family protein [Gammaproteobacteria bacterium]
MDEQKLVKGIGGWLAFLILVLVAISPLISWTSLTGTIAQIESNTPTYLLSDQWQNYKTAEWVLLIVTVGMSMSAGISLYRNHRPGSVNYTIFCLWAIGIGSPITDLLITLGFFGSDKMNAALPLTLGELIRGFFVAGIWTAYLMKSKRVRNTYYSEPVANATVVESADDNTG